MSIKDGWWPQKSLMKNIKGVIGERFIDGTLGVFLYSVIIVLYSNFLPLLRFFKENFTKYNTFFAVQYSISGVIMMIILTSLIIFPFSFIGRKAIKIVGSICIIAGFIYSYLAFNFNVYISEEIIKDVLFANSNDITGVLTDWFFTKSIIPFILFFLILPLWISLKLNIVVVKGYNLIHLKRYLKTVVLLLVLAFVICPQMHQKKMRENVRKQIAHVSILFPTDALSISYGHALCVAFNACNKHEKLRDYDIDKFSYQPKSEQNQKPLIAIFIIGESLRSDRLSVNGYERPTTKFLQEHIENKNLSVFKDVLSCDILTESAVPCLTSGVKMDVWLNKKRKTPKAFSSILTKLGLETYFYGIQHSVIADRYMGEFFDTKYRFVREDLQAIDGRNDGFYLDKYLIDHLKNDVKEDTVYVIHTEGSHLSYNSRYSKEHALFGEDTLSDQYDNSVVAFDDYMKAMVNKFQNSNAIIIYTSDHGESLGEIDEKTKKEVWYHGIGYREDAPQEQRNVPMVVWMSKEFIKNNPEKNRQVRKLFFKRDNLNLSHDNIWHSFLDCIGVQSSMIDTTLSICSGDFDENHINDQQYYVKYGEFPKRNKSGKFKLMQDKIKNINMTLKKKISLNKNKAKRQNDGNQDVSKKEFNDNGNTENNK